MSLKHLLEHSALSRFFPYELPPSDEAAATRLARQLANTPLELVGASPAQLASELPPPSSWTQKPSPQLIEQARIILATSSQKKSG